LWCETGVLYCDPCATLEPAYTCSWGEFPDGDYYFCTETDQGPDPSGTYPESCSAADTDTDTDTDTDADGGTADAGTDAGADAGK
jgi:hypothetical protein